MLARQSLSGPVDSLMVDYGAQSGFIGGLAKKARSFAERESLADVPSRTRPPIAVLFRGEPSLVNGQAVLFDSAVTGGPLPKQATIRGLHLRFLDGTPAPAQLDAGLYLLLFVGDLAAPSARIRLVDIVRQQGERPLNLRRQADQVVRLILLDPAGAWSQKAPAIEIALDC